MQTYDWFLFILGMITDLCCSQQNIHDCLYLHSGRNLIQEIKRCHLQTATINQPHSPIRANMNKAVSVTFLLLLNTVGHFNFFRSGMELESEQERKGNIHLLASNIIQRGFGRQDYCSFSYFCVCCPFLSSFCHFQFNLMKTQLSQVLHPLHCSQDSVTHEAVMKQCPKQPGVLTYVTSR